MHASNHTTPLEESRIKRWVAALRMLSPVFRIVIAIVLCIHVAAILVLVFEKKANDAHFTSFWDAIWWAIVTMTTVGYGDKYPTTPAGRLIAVALMYCSIVLVSLFTATISSIYVARKIQEGRGLENVKFKGHVLICGWNAATPKLLEALSSAAHLDLVLVNEAPPEVIDNYLEVYDNLEIRFVRGNFARETVLDRANVRDAAVAIILPDASLSVGHEEMEDTHTIEATVMIKDMAPEVKVYAHVMDADRVANLRRASVDDVVVTDEYVPSLLASHVTSPGTAQIFHELLLQDSGHWIQRVPIPEEYVGERFDALFRYFKRENNCILLGYITEDEGFRLDDALSGGNAAIVEFIRRKVRQAGISTTTKGGLNAHINPPGDEIIEEGASALVIT